MKQTVFAIAIAALSLVSVAGIAQAAPMAPLAAGVATDHGNLTQVRWHHRHCWWGPRHHRHCRYW